MTVSSYHEGASFGVKPVNAFWQSFEVILPREVFPPVAVTAKRSAWHTSLAGGKILLP